MPTREIWLFAETLWLLVLYGGPGRTRTFDLRIMSHKKRWPLMSLDGPLYSFPLKSLTKHNP